MYPLGQQFRIVRFEGKLTRHDVDQKKIEDRGWLALSIQIMPKDIAEQRPAGHGRDDPNSNPFLPPPVGRLQFSVNPFTMGKELIGPELCFKICCCFICVFACVAVAVLGIYYQTIFAPIIASIEGDD